MRIAEFCESSNLWTHIALSGLSWKYAFLSIGKQPLQIYCNAHVSVMCACVYNIFGWCECHFSCVLLFCRRSHGGRKRAWKCRFKWKREANNTQHITAAERETDKPEKKIFSLFWCVCLCFDACVFVCLVYMLFCFCFSSFFSKERWKFYIYTKTLLKVNMPLRMWKR